MPAALVVIDGNDVAVQHRMRKRTGTIAPRIYLQHCLSMVNTSRSWIVRHSAQSATYGLSTLWTLRFTVD